MAGQATSTIGGGALRLDAVGCVRGGRLLFEGLDLTLAPGDAAIVTGPNGAGKSSLLRIAAGLLVPGAGRVTRVGGIAWLGEAHALDPEARLRDALRFWSALDGCEAALDRLGLAHLADVPVRLLSTGQRRRAALARTIASAAWLWLLDEPTNGLDLEGVASVETLVADHRARGGAVMTATHQPLAMPGARTIALG